MLFKDVATLALDHRAKTKTYRNRRSFERWETVLRIYLMPELENVEISEITSDTIVEILAPLWKTKTTTAQMCRVVMEYILGFAIRKHLRPATDFNPARWKDGLSFDLPVPSDVHTTVPHEAITVGETQRIMPKLATGSDSQKALAFGILTACRATEFRMARWSEIDFENRIFFIPPDRCKVRRTEPFRVPLSRQAVDILKSIKRHENTDFIFRTRCGTTPSITSIRNTLKRLLPSHVSATTHGCRATFSTWCAETGKEPAVREASLMHVDGNRVSRAYNRSDLLDMRRLLMQEWADAIFHS